VGKANERTKVLATDNSGPYHVKSKFRCETMGAPLIMKWLCPITGKPFKLSMKFAKNNASRK
jgi:hypothetical protein